MKLKLATFLAFVCSLGLAQTGIRVGDSLPIQNTAVVNGVTVLVPGGVNSIQFCTRPANAVPCTNLATTYTSATLGTACTGTTQVVLAGTTTCVQNTDSLGNWGVWVASGNYEWTFTNASGASFGPYPVTANSSPNVEQWSALVNPVSNLALSMGANTTAFSWSGLSNTANAFSMAPTSTGGGFKLLGDGELVLGTAAAYAPPPLSVMLSGTGASVPVQNKLTCLSTGSFGPGTISGVNCGTANTSGAVIGICQQNCGAGTGVIAIAGVANCAFDNNATYGDWAIVSTTIAGDCHDAGASVPATSVSTIGRVLNTGAAAVYPVLLQISR